MLHQSSNWEKCLPWITGPTVDTRTQHFPRQQLKKLTFKHQMKKIA